jgi:S-adenosylmethionine decarboxylase
VRDLKYSNNTLRKTRSKPKEKRRKLKNTEPTNINRHIVADLYEIQNVDFFDKIDNMKTVIHEAAGKAGMNIVGEAFKQFEPSGSSGVILLAESHLTYHLWYTERIITLDVYTCGKEGDPQIALDHIIDVLKPNLEKSRITHLDRSFSI